METRITITISEHGRDEANLERVLDAFLETVPESGPVVDANTRLGTLTVTFTLEVEDLDELKSRSAKVFGDAMTATGLPFSEILDVDVAVVSAAAELQRELQPA